MPANSPSFDDKFIPETPLHPEGAAFLKEVTGMLDGRPKESDEIEATLSGWDGFLEKIGAELYHIASMLVGEGEDAIRLIEQVVANVDLPGCCDQADARHKGRILLAKDAIADLRQRDAIAHTESLSAPAEESGPVSCIEDDDLSAAGVSTAELEQMISGPDSHRLRDWLEGLPASLRVVFVLRAVAGLSSAEVSELLSEDVDPAWTADGVRSTFRQALCSLASQLIHTAAAR